MKFFLFFNRKLDYKRMKLFALYFKEKIVQCPLSFFGKSIRY